MRVHDPVRLSIVATLYNSGSSIDEFYRRVSAEAALFGGEYEIVLVDDGSPDDSLARATRLVHLDSRVRVVELSRNFGHHKAMMAGMDHARGEYIFLIDSDLEEPPEILTQFRTRMAEGDWDVVFGYQARRKGGLVERYGGALAWLLIDALYSTKIPRNQCTARLMKRLYVENLLRHRESNTVIGGLWAITGFHQIGVPITKTRLGNSTYTFGRRWATLLNGMTSFSTAPLLFMTYFGLGVSAISFAFGFYVAIRRLFFATAAGWASLIASIWFVGGIVVLCLGVLGLYVSRIFVETKNRPYVIIRNVHERLDQ